MSIYEYLPLSLKQAAISLEDVNIKSYAWTLKDTFEILKSIQHSYPKLIILGGDLYIDTRKRNVILRMKENWYYEPVGNNDDSQKSILKAETYLNNYITHPLGDHIIVDIVVKNKV